MRRIETILSLGLGFGISGGAIAQDDALPLLPPVSAPSQTTTSQESRSGIEPKAATASPDHRAVLAIPGLNQPPTSRRRVEKPTREPADPTAASDLPPLVGPSEMPVLRRSFSPVARPATEDRSRPLVLESVPQGVDSDSPAQLTTPPSRRDPSRTETPASKPTSAPAPRRSPGLFGRMFPTPFVPPRAGSSDSIKVEPRTDPASDAALKRRIEHQIRQTFGDRLREVEVRVVGREVTVRGRATRFWQRRGLQRSLESIPSLSGLRSTVEVD
ncbi:hypothetical protein Sinac_2325 [Singulisphaera acidiphila DSM 18658]|uniref:Uncharacterized protein n=1 Tax=Singulisphaera acidiphila (strain ATCC BAA-1392 / DSM 18658 / VKM B-2454 / MOB10) TaxID=886293 RepID=L0DBL6_SINAD|nr:hypothetical protein Sinac_2325 [Singulisphaera acidiphila DSM 18658]